MILIFTDSLICKNEIRKKLTCPILAKIRKNLQLQK